MHGRTVFRRTFALLAALVCASSAGCASCQRPQQNCCAPKIVPGNPLYTTDTPYHQVPGPIGHHDTTKIMVTPAKVIAPVGSEVVVQAAVCGQDRTLMAGEKVEWSVAPSSVGYIVQAGETGALDWMHHVGYRTRKVDNTFAVSATSSKFIMLNRGTPTPDDDVPILKGQAWTTVSSPVEGTSFVTAVAPDVYGWDGRKQTATIYWVDAQWTLPPPAVNSAGTRHAFTTMLTRHTNHCPLVGWRVRYDIAGGPPAGFAPDGVQSIEVPTNALGQATVEIFQTQPQAGTNTVNITIIRPADFPGGDGAPLVVGAGTTQKTWTSATASGLSIDKSGPPEAVVGGTVTYRIVVRNPGDLSARGLVVTDAIPSGLAFVGSVPQAQMSGTTLTWNLGDLAGGQSRQIEMSFQAQQPAVVNNCATVRTADGFTAQDCAATTITQPTVELTLAGPSQANVGDDVVFVATITNRGSSPATNLVLIDRFDEAGLKHEFSASPIENRELGTLAVGQTQRVNVKLRVTQPGRWCNTMELSGDNGVRTSSQSCITAVQPASPPPVVTPPPSSGTPPAAVQPQLTIRKTGPARAAVGDTIVFTIVVENRGAVPVTNVRVLDNYDLALKPTRASDGWQLAGNDIYWNLPQLLPNQAYERKVECLCQSPGTRACNRATVTTQENVRADAEACLEITGRRDLLSVTVSAQRNPVVVNDEIVYTVKVSNNAPVSDREVTVAVTLPNETIPVAGHAGPTQAAVNNRIVRFAPVAEIRAGETLTFTVRAAAKQAGNAEVRVDVSSNAAQTPVSAAAVTNIFAQ